LTDWGEGTTEEAYDIGGASFNVPMLHMFQAMLGPEWDIHPDSEADFVKQEREQMLRRLPMLPTIPQSARDEIGSLEPPLTSKDFKRDEKRTEELREKYYKTRFEPPLMLDAAHAHASERARLNGIIEALEIIQRDEFYGEDPVWPEIRAIIESTQEEAERFTALWEQANEDWELRQAFYKLQGLEHPEINVLTNLEEIEPAPMPTEAPTTEDELQLIRGWGS
ncbi:MAG: hypothetical protein KC435_14875, partial [Thermomicrobiales bacterium]|nr:hypothetical protein [Thermomicrobiales bacterium]